MFHVNWIYFRILEHTVNRSVAMVNANGEQQTACSTYVNA